MKIILTILFAFTLSLAKAQVQTSYVVSSIAQMKTYYGTASKIYVAEKNADYVICSPCTPDEVNIYAGAGGRKWMKVSDSAKADVGSGGSGTTDTALIKQIVSDSLSAIPPDTLYAGSPIYFDGDTAKFKSDSLHTVLKYTGAAKDSTNYDDTTLIPKGYLNQRLAGIDASTSLSGGDTTIFETIVDSTGQPQRRVLFSGGSNHISSSPKILIDSANSKVGINVPNISIGGADTKLYVKGNVTFDAGTKLPGLGTSVSDTGTYKPAVLDGSGNVKKLDRWPGGGGTSSITAYDSTITATSSQTVFTFSSFPSTASYISVFINSCAIDDSYYTYDAATQTLTFTSGLVDGDKIRLHIIE